MKGLVVSRDHRLYVTDDLPMPAYGSRQALVKMVSCGICSGTDTKIIHGELKNFNSYPAVLGHEGLGEVVAVGDKVRNLCIGDRVLLPFQEGVSEGKEGPYYSGFGAFTEYAVVGDMQAFAEDGRIGSPGFSANHHAQMVLSPSDRVDAVNATMIVTFREVLSAMKRFRLEPNRDIVVFGVGPVGMCFIRFAKLLGLGTVIGVDITDEKVAAALAMHADAAFNSRTCDVSARIQELLPGGANYVVDAVGVTDLINQAMGLLSDHGKICVYGISPNMDMRLDWKAAPYNWSLEYVQMPLKTEEAEAHAQVMSWINTGVINPDDYITHVFPFERILDAFHLLDEKQPGTQKIVITF